MAAGGGEGRGLGTTDTVKVLICTRLAAGSHFSCTHADSFTNMRMPGLADLVDLTETPFAQQVHEEVATVMQYVMRLEPALLLIPDSLQLPAIAMALLLGTI